MASCPFLDERRGLTTSFYCFKNFKKENWHGDKKTFLKDTAFVRCNCKDAYRKCPYYGR